MAAIARPRVCENRLPPRRSLLASKRVNCNEAIPYPTDGQAREWWHRLKNAFGTASSAFVGASLQQLIAAARRCAPTQPRSKPYVA